MAAINQQDVAFSRAHQTFLEEQGKRKIHPLDDKIEGIHKVTQSFVELFEKTPNHMKATLATSPLFPKDVDFSECSMGSRDSTCPLNYVMFAANKKALEMLCPYLKKKDWEKLGPYQSTFMHCIIAGIDKGSAQKGDPIGCAEILIENYPLSKTTTNQFEQLPICYLQVVKGNWRHDELTSRVASNLQKMLLVEDSSEQKSDS